ncbi:DUF6153 family protein [Actinomycetospora lemnae]|uniref:DUF6153 family protein n=1 Tax=Actinomycetospora lemnae TaxID=3019891 RepID=A0ABT5SYW5_9PSEU|nr:DUF6153 family protein [Actinomycetospora sp. DW7H6]MDD7968054.1 DUF6153 family protein [Actinomycetospora sp. DW7H6]
MIRWHGSSRRRAGGAVSTTPSRGSWCGRLALLVVALGLVLMHHVVGAHQHSTPDVASPPMPAPAVVGHAAPSTSEHHHGGDAVPSAGVDQHGTTPDGMSTASSAALLHHHPDEGGHDHAGSLLHLCLVALVGGAAFLLVLVLVALWWRPPPRRVGPAGGAPATAPRAPPASSRLAELQVLRL